MTKQEDQQKKLQYYKPEDVKDLICHIISNNQYLEKEGLPKNALEVVGEAGIGKTSLIGQIATDLGMQYRKINLAQLDDLGDLVGFPIRECLGEDNKWYNEKQIEADNTIKLTEKTRTSWCPPEWVPEDASSGGILLLDDYSRAQQRFMQASMELVETQEYMSWKLPNNWHIILTSNPDNGKYFVAARDEAQETRTMTIGMKYDNKDWARWAESANIDSRCINFALFNEEMIEKTNARIATKFFNSISSVKDLFSDAHLVTMLGNASVGQEFVHAFSLFVNKKLDKLPTPSEVLVDEKDDEKVINRLRGLFGNPEKVTYKNDIANIICTRLINKLKTMTTKKALGTTAQKKKLISRVESIIIEEVFSKDILLNFIKEVNSIKAFEVIMANSEVSTLVAGQKKKRKKK